MSKKLPRRLYATIEGNTEGNQEDLLAWRTIDSADDGRVGVYVLEEELDKRQATELRRDGTKKWFKARSR